MYKPDRRATNALALSTDQRGPGFARVVNLAMPNASDGTDFGAFEARSAPLGELIFANGFEN